MSPGSVPGEQGQRLSPTIKIPGRRRNFLFSPRPDPGQAAAIKAWVWKWDDGPERGDFRFVLGRLARNRPKPAVPLAEFDVEAAAGAIREFFRARNPRARRRLPAVHRERMEALGHPWLRVGPFAEDLTAGLVETLRGLGLTAGVSETWRPLDDGLCKRFWLASECGETRYDPGFGQVVQAVEDLRDDGTPGASAWLTLGDNAHAYVQTAANQGGYLMEWGRCPPPDDAVALHKAGRREPGGAVLDTDPKGRFATFENEVLSLAEVLAIFGEFYERRPRPEERFAWRDVSGDVPRA